MVLELKSDFIYNFDNKKWNKQLNFEVTIEWLCTVNFIMLTFCGIAYDSTSDVAFFFGIRSHSVVSMTNPPPTSLPSCGQ